MRLMIAFSTASSMPADFLPEFYKIACRNSPVLPFVMQAGPYIAQNRNRIVKTALADDSWDRLVFLDNDMYFPDNFRQIAESWTDPVVGGLYFRRNYPSFLPVPGNFPDLDKHNGLPVYIPLQYEEIKQMRERKGLYKVGMVGCGCVGIRRDVLEEWDHDHMPWFDTLPSWDGWEMGSEDVYFSWKLGLQNIPVYLDSRIMCGHQGTIPVGVETFMDAHVNPPFEEKSA